MTSAFLAARIVLMALLATSAAASGAAAGSEERLFVINIEGGSVARDKQRVQVKQGDRVRLRFTSDRKIALHLHGYDIKQTARPHVVTEMFFEATAAGRFPVFVHSAGGGGHAHHAPVIEVEVRPR